MFRFDDWKKELDVMDRISYRQMEVISIDLSQAVSDQMFNKPGSNLVLVPTILDKDGKEYTSDVAHRVYIAFNEQNTEKIAFSLIANSKDNSAYSGTYKRFFVSVTAANVSAGAKLYLVNFIGAGVSSATGGTSSSSNGTQANGGGGL